MSPSLWCLLRAVMRLCGVMLWTPGLPLKAASNRWPGGPRLRYEPSSPLSNYVTLGNLLTSLKTQFLLLTSRDNAVHPPTS